MKDLGLIITPVNPREMPVDAQGPVLDFANRIRAEKYPDDPPTSPEEFAANLLGIPSFVEIHAWHVREAEGGPLIAAADVVLDRMGQNKHVASFSVGVAPEHRRRGIASHLLGRLIAVAKEDGRTLLMAGSSGRVPSGAAFLQHIGAEKGLESHTNQLTIADLDRGLLRDWQERAAERAGGFELFWSEDALSDDLLPGVCDLANAVADDIPRGDLQMESFRVTPEQVREMERGALASGERMWFVFARERATGALAGFTMLFWNPHAPYRANQGITGVLPQYRGLGLGRWVKAAMLERLADERPEVRFVRTNNADSNAAMLGINRALGFQPYSSDISWQVPVERAEAYLVGATG